MPSSIVRSCLALALFAGVGNAADGPHQTLVPVRYTLERLDSLGGTSSVGVSINDRGWVAGRSNLPSGVRHAALWRDGVLTDLGALGGPDKPSTVLWPVKNVRGIVSGIAYTNEPDPNGERWSCGFFLTSPGTRCFGFRWEDGLMTPLPPFAGGTHSFATGTNNLGFTVGWAENAVVDSTCVAPQRLRFRAAVWGPGGHIVRELRPLPGSGDTTTAATAINDRGQVVGISGVCDQAAGRFSAIHSVLWQPNGQVVNLGDFGGVAWNTPNMINLRGDVVGFANASAADGGTQNFRPFLKRPGHAIQQLPMLPGAAHGSAQGINEWRHVVGDSCDAAGVCRAVVWLDGAVHDLNALVDDQEDRLTIAKDVDDFGRITGQGFDDETNTFFAFVATPVWH
jgi:probable HAF family extracellular repeat protein